MDLNNFITWAMFQDFASFVAIVFMVVQFFKEIRGINKIPTKYFAALVSFVILVIVGLKTGALILVDPSTYWNLFLYLITSISISALSKGIVDYNNDKTLKQLQDQVTQVNNNTTVVTTETTDNTEVK